MNDGKNTLIKFSTIPLLALAVNAQAEWKYTIAPYLWASNLDGTTTVAGRDIEFEADFSDLVQSLDAGFALLFRAKGDRWGYFADGSFVKLSEDQQTIIGNLGVEVDQKIVEGGVSYSLSEQFDLIGGVRYQKIDVDATLPILGKQNTGDSWADGFIGALWTPVATDKWSLWLSGDFGAGDSDSVWQGRIGGAYHFNETWSLALAYRYLSTDFESDKFKWDVNQSGYGIGLGISW